MEIMKIVRGAQMFSYDCSSSLVRYFAFCSVEGKWKENGPICLWLDTFPEKVNWSVMITLKLPEDGVKCRWMHH